MTARITTFYSYKGGSGRSMTMANVAWALATNGERVLAIDWDLEAPGLHRYFHPFLSDPEQSSSEGLIDRVWDYIEAMGSESASVKNRFHFARCDEQVQKLDLPVRSRGCLHLLGAGRQDALYSEKVGGLDWGSFYARFDGKAFIDHLIRWARQKYTHILIDSRTGVADTAGICTAQVADAVIMCFVYNRQSIEGTAAIAESITKMRDGLDLPPLSIRTIPCRVEERGVAESARRFAASRLARSSGAHRSDIEMRLRRDEIRHFPWCAFEEKLAVFEEGPEERGSLLENMHELAAQIAEREMPIANVEPSLLQHYWRRAAFDDPRFADLEALAEESQDNINRQLFAWLDEALERRDERADWLMALAEALFNMTRKGDEGGIGSNARLFTSASLRLAERAYTQDPDLYRHRLALLQQSQGGRLRMIGDDTEALALFEASARLLDPDESSLGRWRQARSILRAAETLDTIGNREAALDRFREAASAFKRINRRDLPLGAELDTPRALRILAQRLLEHGLVEEAKQEAEAAMRGIERLSGFRTADAREIVAVLTTRAEIAATLSPETLRNDLLRVRMLAGKVLSSDETRALLERRLTIIEARACARTGRLEEGIGLIRRHAAVYSPTVSDPFLLEAELEMLLDAGRSDEAIMRIRDLFEDRSTRFSPNLLDLADRAFSSSGMQEAFHALIKHRMERAGDKENMAFRRAFANYIVHTSDNGRYPWPAPEFRDTSDTQQALD